MEEWIHEQTHISLVHFLKVLNSIKYFMFMDVEAYRLDVRFSEDHIGRCNGVDKQKLCLGICDVPISNYIEADQRKEA